MEHEPQASAGWDSRSGSVSGMGGSPLGSLLCEMGAEQTSCDTVGLWPPHTGLCCGFSKALSPPCPVPDGQFRLLLAGAHERCSRPVFTRGRRAGTGQDPDGPGKGDLHPGLSRRSDWELGSLPGGHGVCRRCRDKGPLTWWLKPRSSVSYSLEAKKPRVWVWAGPGSGNRGLERCVPGACWAVASSQDVSGGPVAGWLRTSGCNWATGLLGQPAVGRAGDRRGPQCPGVRGVRPGREGP